MTLRRTLARLFLAGSVIAAGLTVGAPPAAAEFHLMMIREVAPDGPGGVDYVELQMYSPGQTQLNGHEIHVWNAAGIRSTATLSGNVPNGESQRTILIATGTMVSGQTADYSNLPLVMSASAGAACFENIDCVAWGSFAPADPPTSPVGAAAPVPGMGQTIERTIARGCATLLDGPDDTNDSAADFALVTPTPRPNSVVPTEQPCAPGSGTGGAGTAELQGLKTRVKGNRAIISGKVQPPAPGDRVKLTFFANGSPLRKVAAKNATLNADSEFKKRFKVPSDSTRCKVVVRFKGAKLGQKKFRC